jgi:purine-nucleoside phosphorylase
MNHYRENVDRALGYIRSRCDLTPGVLLLTGTGLGDLAGGIDEEYEFDYGEIPHFPRSTVESHAGILVLGRLKGRPMAVMRGRFHLYEGYSPRDVVFPIRVLREMGVKTLIVSNASGGLNPEYSTGDIMLIRDHINLTGENPLTGPNIDEWGLRFPDMVAAYDPVLRSRAREVAVSLGLPVREGVYAGLKGPSLETPAEMRYLRTIGADAVGFSTIMETIAARHGGMRVLGLSLITNTCDPDHPEAATVEGVIAAARKASPGLESLVETLVENDHDLF